ncbi:hypothetical protein [Cyanobium sp. HWJ4-Hawea]|uniref:hypothetical protein n=1 Tax=Cyanobium sp. HWJ4-Hawea TaxID=2823713 RepID=UPI0020CCD404|nr:hypothetical protein [Cyanobium sp. HWJ4-Hawea]
MPDILSTGHLFVGRRLRRIPIRRGPVDQRTGSGHLLIVFGFISTYLVVNDSWDEPDLIPGSTLDAKKIGFNLIFKQALGCGGGEAALQLAAGNGNE